MANGQSGLASSPKDVFLHLLMIVTLYMSIVSFIALLFQYITVLFPDALDYFLRGSLDAIRWSTAVLVVSFPVFIGISWLLEKEFAANPKRRELAVRKWLVYLTLFIAALVIIIDLITIIYNFYGGDVTVRFFLRALVVLAVAGAVFGYYLWDLRRTKETISISRAAAWAAGAVVFISVVAGFFVVGSPAEQRRIRLDEQRVSHLQQVQSEIVQFWMSKGRLPENLQEMEEDSIRGFFVPRDPETNEPYGYSVLGDLAFELCADFAAESLDERFGNARRPIAVPHAYDASDPYSQSWSHEAGNVCFERLIDPDRHKDIFQTGPFAPSG